MSDNRFCFVDGLRGLASLAVVFFHAYKGAHIDMLPSGFLATISYGDLGVAVFFVISGFVIAHSLRDQNLDALGLGKFVLRRSIRLDPPYWIAIAMTLCFSQLASFFVAGSVPVEYSAKQIVAHLFYAQEIIGYPQINLVFWTLCYEFQFYLVFALLLAAGSTKLMVVAFAASLLWPLGLAPEIRGLFPNLFYGFLLGVGTYFCWRHPRVRVWFALYSIIIFTASLVDENRFGIVCVATAALIALVALRGQLATVLKWWPLQFLGLISYSLYLTHNTVSGASFRIWYTLMGHSPTSEAFGLGLTVLACITAAAVMYYVVEKPCIRLSKALPVRFARTTVHGHATKMLGSVQESSKAP
jgi:peptidoglycan/LPS O-acetylase OafA/YrhL